MKRRRSSDDRCCCCCCRRRHVPVVLCFWSQLKSGVRCNAPARPAASYTTSHHRTVSANRKPDHHHHHHVAAVVGRSTFCILEQVEALETTSMKPSLKAVDTTP